LAVVTLLLLAGVDWVWSWFGGRPFATCAALPLLYRSAQALPYLLGLWGALWFLLSGFKKWLTLLLVVAGVVLYDAPEAVLMLLEPVCA
jgi:hypothetical protein